MTEVKYQKKLCLFHGNEQSKLIVTNNMDPYKLLFYTTSLLPAKG